MTLAAVIPNRDGGTLLERCLEALAGAEGVDDVVVVDDGSTDGSDARAAELGARVVRSPGSGFSTAVNHGVAQTATDCALLLNSDAFVDPPTPRLLAEALDGDPRLALVGAGMRDEQGLRAKSHGDALTLRRAIEIGLGIPGRQPPEQPGIQEVTFVPLACALVRRRAYDEVGGLDGGYVFYFEDYDLCWRLAEAGWKLAVRWDPGAVHIGGGSSSASDPARWLPRFQTSRMRYLRKRYGRRAEVFPLLWGANASVHSALWIARAAAARARGKTSEAARARRWAGAYLRSAARL